MRLMHLSDLHLGKRLENYSLLEDQRYILAQVLNIIDRECPDAILIAGDVYYRSVPSVEAVALFGFSPIWLRESRKCSSSAGTMTLPRGSLSAES